MSDKQRKSLTTIVGAVAVIGLVAAVYIFTPRPEAESSTTEADTGKSAQIEAAENSEEGGDEELAGWGSYTTETESILIRAEDAEKVRGKMQLATAPDNPEVTDESGERAGIQYVGAADNSCGKDANPADNAAVFKVTIESSGTYYPWARVWWKDSCGDSLAILLKSGQGEEREFTITDGTHEWWHWLPVAGSGGVQLDPGTYTLVVENREDGARLGRILLVTQDYETYMPTTPEG